MKQQKQNRTCLVPEDRKRLTLTGELVRRPHSSREYACTLQTWNEELQSYETRIQLELEETEEDNEALTTVMAAEKTAVLETVLAPEEVSEPEKIAALETVIVPEEVSVQEQAAALETAAVQEQETKTEQAQTGGRETRKETPRREGRPQFSESGNMLYFLSNRQGGTNLYCRELAAGTLIGPLLPLAEEEEVREYCLVKESGVGMEPDRTVFYYITRTEQKKLPPEGTDWELPIEMTRLRMRRDADLGIAREYRWKLQRFCPQTAAKQGDSQAEEGCRPQAGLLLQTDTPIRGLCAAPGGILYENGGSCFYQAAGEKTAKEVFAGYQQAALRPTVYFFQYQDRLTALTLLEKKNTQEAKQELCFWDWEQQERLPLPDPSGVCSWTVSSAGMEGMQLAGAQLVEGEEKLVWYAIGVRDAVQDIYRIALQEEGCSISRLTKGAGSYLGLTAPVDGTLLALYGDWQTPFDVFSFAVDSESGERLVDHNVWLQEYARSTLQRLTMPSQDGLAMLQGYLVIPPVLSRQEAARCLLWIHGGPYSYYTDTFNFMKMTASTQGYAILLPNPRGSSGFGMPYGSPEAAFGPIARNDMLHLLDYVLNSNAWIGKNRIGLIGGSYGGFSSAYLAGTTKRFAAAVVCRAVTNWLLINFKSQQSGQNPYEEYHDFQDYLVETLRESPILYAGEVNIPTLILHGEKDQVCPVENAHQYYTALRDNHPQLPLRMVLFPDCGHNMNAAPMRDYIRYQQEYLAWLDRYL